MLSSSSSLSSSSLRWEDVPARLRPSESDGSSDQPEAELKGAASTALSKERAFEIFDRHGGCRDVQGCVITHIDTKLQQSLLLTTWVESRALVEEAVPFSEGEEKPDGKEGKQLDVWSVEIDIPDAMEKGTPIKVTKALEGGKTVVGPCKTCHATGTATCDNCNGNKKNTCYRCQGRGKAECSSCRGSGYGTCYICQGKGQVERRIDYNNTKWENCTGMGCKGGKTDCNSVRTQSPFNVVAYT
jgi:hypothetical protein